MTANTRLEKEIKFNLPENAKRISLDNGKISAIKYANSLKNEVVFLHGAGLYGRSFENIAQSLKVGSLAIDVPGHGHSEWLDDEDFSPNNLAKRLQASINELNLKNQIVVGHSMGGLTAAMIIKNNPEFCKELILIDIMPGIANSNVNFIHSFLAEPTHFDSIEDVINHAIKFGLGKSPDDLLKGVYLNTKYIDGIGYIWRHQVANLAQKSDASVWENKNPQPLWECLDKLHYNKQPMTLLAASNGFLNNSDLARWHERYPESRVVEISGSHNLHDSNPKEVIKEIERALKS